MALPAPSPNPYADALIWSRGAPTAPAQRLVSPKATLAARVALPDSDGPLLGWQDASGAWATCLEILSAPTGPTLGFTLKLAAERAPLRLGVPVATIGRHQPHEILLRHLGHRLEFWVDGVLVDEEWPAGLPLQLPGDLHFFGEAVDQVAGWGQALDDARVRQLCGALTAPAERYLGPEQPIGQGWRPPGHNVNVGDCMPCWHEGRFHLFYLRDRRHHGSMWGCGGHQWAHASTTDLVHWEHHPLAVAIDDRTAGSICTGSVFFHAGVHHAFYSVRRFDGSAAPLCVSTSRNGVDYIPGGALGALRAPYDTAAGRDPVVFAHGGQFHMLVTTALLDGAEPRGCLAHLVSTDLRHWEQHEPFFVPGPDYPGQPECADHFAWNGWHYLLFSIEGVARYRFSRHPLGPWTRPATDTLDEPCARVMKTAAFGSDRRLGVAFVPDRGGWGGVMRFRELVQHPDGTLTTRWPAELPPR